MKQGTRSTPVDCQSLQLQVRETTAHSAQSPALSAMDGSSRFASWIRTISVILWVAMGISVSGCQRSRPTPVASSGSTSQSPDADTVEIAPAISETELQGGADSAPAGDDSAADSTLPKESLSSAEPASKLTEGPLPIPAGNWTTQRLIGLTPKGPFIMDLMLRVGGLELEATNAAAVQPIQESLLAQLGSDPKWEALLEMPLIKSGWLGNIVADENQATQLISMYDKDKDGVVQATEITEFLTRGLSRSQPIVISDSGNEPNPDTKKSPFGVLDQDQDNLLSAEELKQGPTTLARLDFNSDSSVSISELSPMSDASPMATGAMGRAMLKATSLVFHQSALSADDSSDHKTRLRKVVEVMEYYSFLGSIERDQWSGWSDLQWQKMDTNGNGTLEKSELAVIFSIEPFFRIALDLPPPGVTESKTQWFCSVLDSHSVPDSHSKWSGEGTSGQLNCKICDVLVTFEDSYSSQSKMQLKNALTAAINNAQAKQFLLQQLQLKENAIELVDSNADKMISSEELEHAWNWLVARQSARFQGRWMIAARPWFQLLDRDRNQSISEVEQSRLPEVLGKMDSNQDDLIDGSELPLAIRFQLTRQDQRLDLRGLQAGDMALSGDSVGEDWFAAMDTNRDKSISKQEFLGANSEFQALDRDGDGFISESDVY